MQLYILSSAVYNSQNLETVQVPISRLVNIEAVVYLIHLHNVILLDCLKKERNLNFCDSIHGLRDLYAK